MINETLHTFISVTKNGSFNKAAEKLSLTAPAVMKQMNSLEKSVGAPLITCLLNHLMFKFRF